MRGVWSFHGNHSNFCMDKVLLIIRLQGYLKIDDELNVESREARDRHRISNVRCRRTTELQRQMQNNVEQEIRNYTGLEIEKRHRESLQVNRKLKTENCKLKEATPSARPPLETGD